MIAPLAGIVWPVADEPPQDKPASDAAAPKDDDDGFVAKLRKVLPDLLDEILGTEPEDKPEEKPKPSTLREKEDSVRDQVFRHVSKKPPSLNQVVSWTRFSLTEILLSPAPKGSHERGSRDVISKGDDGTEANEPFVSQVSKDSGSNSKTGGITSALPKPFPGHKGEGTGIHCSDIRYNK